MPFFLGQTINMKPLSDSVNSSAERWNTDFGNRIMHHSLDTAEQLPKSFSIHSILFFFTEYPGIHALNDVLACTPHYT